MEIRGSCDAPVRVEALGNADHGFRFHRNVKLRAPATYAIRVEKSGFVPFTTKVQLPPDAELKVEAELSRRGAVAWYQHWYVLAGLGLVVAGAAGTTIYFATRDEATGLTFDGSIQ